MMKKEILAVNSGEIDRIAQRQGVLKGEPYPHGSQPIHAHQDHHCEAHGDDRLYVYRAHVKEVETNLDENV